MGQTRAMPRPCSLFSSEGASNKQQHVAAGQRVAAIGPKTGHHLPAARPAVTSTRPETQPRIPGADTGSRSRQAQGWAGAWSVLTRSETYVLEIQSARSPVTRVPFLRHFRAAPPPPSCPGSQPPRIGTSRSPQPKVSRKLTGRSPPPPRRRSVNARPRAHLPRDQGTGVHTRAPALRW